MKQFSITLKLKSGLFLTTSLDAENAVTAGKLASEIAEHSGFKVEEVIKVKLNR